MDKIIIAIDGYSSTGKSTIAKALAKRLNYIYIDTGAMYRAVTYFAIKNNLIKNNKVDKAAVIEALPKIKISFHNNEETQVSEVCLNGINIENHIRSLKVSSHVSDIATIAAVREKLVEQQQHIGKDKGLVMDGRDIGTVVFPGAEIKIFMTASTEVRAKRRYDELRKREEKISFKEVQENILKRDQIDTSREVSPLIKAEDAIEIDNSSLTLKKQIDRIFSLIKKQLNKTE